MGWGKFIVLTCECGFKTNRAQVGQLLGHECTAGTFTIMDATYDPDAQRIVTHHASLPLDLEERLDATDNSDAEHEANAWFENQRNLTQDKFGPVLQPPESAISTEYKCPRCKETLVLTTDGNWIA